MCDQRIKVLYVSGWGRSGTTILGNILGEIKGFFHVGEVRLIWESLIENRLCGSGVPLKECEVWRDVLDRAFGGIEQINANEMLRLRESVDRTRYIPLMLIPGGKRLLAPHLWKYLDNSRELYRAIQFSTGSDVIVDSSKSPSYAYLLGMIPIIDLYVVHLIRDPRATAYSWLRKKLSLDTESATYMPQYSSTKSALLWNVWNVTAEMCWGHSRERYMILRYEDLIRKPEEAVRHTLDLVHETAIPLPFVGECEVELGVNHTVSGNPSRFQRGKVKLRLDDEWETRIRPLDRIIVTALTWPLLLRYKYIGSIDGSLALR